ncbi:MAG: arsenosugar biosynthesis radical SAM protein ArsS [Gammaproteobacteria bacterium]|nr:arsenosugar biosynthesis radical SAM protein ArsS [Gammaproteobacteria bacterium]
MRDTLPLLVKTDFPAIRRSRLDTLQVNLGYRCNQSCVHCHVSAGPKRTEMMSERTVSLLIEFIDATGIRCIDITGGAPELNLHFRSLVRACRERGLRIIDRCNLTILEEPEQSDLGEFLAAHRVEITASMPCYQIENVDAQRGKGVFDDSIRALRRLNALGYGDEDSGLILNLVFNPQGPVLPPDQQALELDYKRVLGESFGIRFNQLLTIANMPIGRFGSLLLSKGRFDSYLDTLKGAHRIENLDTVMCRSLVSVDWQGYVYDCDFNQMLGLPLNRQARAADGAGPATHLSELLARPLQGEPIVVGEHCYACTAGQGSSCGGALN